MFSYFEPNFIEKFHWEMVFQILVTWLFLRNKNFFCLAAILKRNIFLTFFLLIYGCFRCIQIWCKFRTEIPTEKYLQMVGS